MKISFLSNTVFGLFFGMRKRIKNLLIWKPNLTFNRILIPLFCMGLWFTSITILFLFQFLPTKCTLSPFFAIEVQFFNCNQKGRWKERISMKQIEKRTKEHTTWAVYFSIRLCNKFPKENQTLRFWGCSIYKKIPPATETLRDSNSPAIGMLTSSHNCQDFSERPLPSLPRTKHNGTSAKESASPWERGDTGFLFWLLSGWPAIIFIWNSFLRVSRWIQLPETIGSWKEAPRLARRAFSLNGSQHPLSRKTPP